MAFATAPAQRERVPCGEDSGRIAVRTVVRIACVLTVDGRHHWVNHAVLVQRQAVHGACLLQHAYPTGDELTDVRLAVTPGSLLEQQD